MEILNESRFACRVTNNAIFAPATSLYLSPTQIIIARYANAARDRPPRFIAGSAKSHARSTCRPTSPSFQRSRTPACVFLFFCVYIQLHGILTKLIINWASSNFLEVVSSRYKRRPRYERGTFTVISFAQVIFLLNLPTQIQLDVTVALMQYTIPQYFSADSHSCDCLMEGQKFNSTVKPEEFRRCPEESNKALSQK